MEKIVTIKRFTYPHEVAIVQGRLESEGVKTFIKDENITIVNPFYSNAVGGIKLQIKESDVPKATEVLKRSGYFQEEDILSNQQDINTSPSFVTLKIIILIAVLVSVIILALFFIFA